MQFKIDSSPLPQDEQIILTPLWQASATFRAFYTAERPKITTPLFWSKMQPEHLSPCCHAARSRLLIDGKLDPREEQPIQIIYLPHIPPTGADALIVAHELSHAVDHCEGRACSVVMPNQSNHPLATVLSGLVREALVVRRLHRCGFDQHGVAPYFPAFWTATIEGRREPVLWIECLVAACEFVQAVVINREIDGRDSFDTVTTAYCRKFPRVGYLIQRLLKLIRRIGFSTPAAQVKLYKAILHDLKLPDLVVVEAL